MKKTQSAKPQMLPGLLALLMGVIGIAVVITTIQTVNTEQRSQAEDATKPSITIKTDPPNPQPFEPLNIEFQINTKNHTISALEMKNVKIAGKTWATLPSKLDTAPAPQLSATENSINPVSSTTAIITYVAGLADTNQPYTTGIETKTFAKFSYVPQSAGTLLIDFDPTQIIVKEANGTNVNIANDPQDTTIAIKTSSSTTTTTADASCLPPSPTNVKAAPANTAGQIRLSWSASSGADHYAISFGPKSHQYQWGAADVGNVREFTIRGLQPGKRYYIVVSAVNSCGGSAFSQEASSLAKAKPTTTVTTKGGETIEVPVASYKPEIVIYNPPPVSIKPSPVASESASPSALPTTNPTPQPGSSPKLPFLKIFLILLGLLLGLFLLSRLIKVRRIDDNDDLSGPRISPREPSPMPGEPESSPSTDYREPTTETPTTLIQEPPLHEINEPTSEQTPPSSPLHHGE